MNKRVVSGILLVLILASLLINIGFVSAQENKEDFPDSELAEGLGQIGDELGGTLGPILLFLFNIEKESTLEKTAQTLFSFVIAFIIVFVFVLIAFKNLPFFDENRGLSYFIVVVAALLGIRGIAQISPGIMNDIFMPYSALALSIINGAAIVGWFMLVNIGMKKEKFNFIRRFLWILFGVTFIGIWGMRTLYSQGESITGLTQWIYWATFILSIIMALIDGSIQGFFAKAQAERLAHTQKTEIIANLRAEKKRFEKMLNENIIDDKVYKELMEDLYRKAVSFLGVKGTKNYKFDKKSLNIK